MDRWSLISVFSLKSLAIALISNHVDSFCEAQAGPRSPELAQADRPLVGWRIRLGPKHQNCCVRGDGWNPVARLRSRVGLRRPEEKKFIEAFVAKFAVEAFDEGILHRLARLDVVLGHPARNPLEMPLKN
jgi:hypothetical protein